MSDTALDWMALANRKAKGKRPEFFDEPEDDRIYSILIALVGEVAVMRSRLDTIERLLDKKGTISREDIENFAPDREAGFERGALIREYILRVMRGPIQAMEALKDNEPPIEEVSKDLRDM
jgi:hypothetical protein